MLMRPTGLTEVEIFFCIFPMTAKLERLIITGRKEYQIQSLLYMKAVHKVSYINDLAK